MNSSRVLVKVAEIDSGGCKVEKYAWLDVTEAQALAYAAGDPAWRSATAEAPSAWASRLWRRLAGDA